MRKIGELKGKPIIEGNPNEIKKNQIHYKESDGGITLSERKEDNTLSSVTSGSGSGEGVKEYYYKIKDEYLNTNIYDILIMDETPLIEFLHMFCGIEAIICPISSISHIEGYAEVYSNFVFTNKLKTIPYFKIMDSSSFIAASYFDDKTIPSNAIIRRKGNISDRIKNSHFGNEEEINYIIELINTYIQEITKEEYESMITYKPE